LNETIYYDLYDDPDELYKENQEEEKISNDIIPNPFVEKQKVPKKVQINSQVFEEYDNKKPPGESYTEGILNKNPKFQGNKIRRSANKRKASLKRKRAKRI